MKSWNQHSEEGLDSNQCSNTELNLCPVSDYLSGFLCHVPAYKTTEKICQQTLTLTDFILHGGKRLALYIEKLYRETTQKKILGTLKSN